MRRVVPIIGFFVTLTLSQLVFTLLWGNSGRLFLLSVLVALSFSLSLGVAYAGRALKRDLEQMSETDRRALRAACPEEDEEMGGLVGEINERHWLSQGVRQFALEMLEIAGVLVALFALPVIGSLVRDGSFSLDEDITVWQLALGFIGAAIYVLVRHWLKSVFERRKNA